MIKKILALSLTLVMISSTLVYANDVEKLFYDFTNSSEPFIEYGGSWDQLSENPYAESGLVVSARGTQNYSFSVIEDKKMEDIDATVKVKLGESVSNQRVGLAFRVTGTTIVEESDNDYINIPSKFDGYIATIDKIQSGNQYTDKVSLLKSNSQSISGENVDTYWETLAEEELKYISPAKEVRLRVFTMKNNIKVYVDGKQLLDINDDTYTSGEVGLFAQKADGVTYKELSITDISSINLTNISKSEKIELDYTTMSKWFVEELEYANENNLITDKISTDFNKPITREEFCEIAIKMYDALGGEKESTSENPFTDTNNESIIRAYNLGITGGTSATTFSPDAGLTRQQLCTFIGRTLKLAGTSYEVQDSFQQDYPDIHLIQSWALESVRSLNYYKIFNGNGVGLDPDSGVTREVGIVLLKRAYEKFK